MPYGRGFINLKIPARNLRKICSPKEPRGLVYEEKEIKEALRNPIKKSPLSTLIDSRDKVAIIIDDITRPTPSYKIISAILNELQIPNENITIIVATGLHRKNTEEELKVMLGHDVLNKVRVVNHDALHACIYVACHLVKETMAT
jgi:nickel-dependent lactate racemase